jgi:hypothetical protein
VFNEYRNLIKNNMESIFKVLIEYNSNGEVEVKTNTDELVEVIIKDKVTDKDIDQVHEHNEKSMVGLNLPQDKPQVPSFDIAAMIKAEVCQKIDKELKIKFAKDSYERDCEEGFQILLNAFNQTKHFIPRMYIRREKDEPNHVVLSYGYEGHETGNVSGTGLRFDIYTHKQGNGGWKFKAQYYSPDVKRRLILHAVELEDVVKGVIRACVYKFDLALN